MTPKPSPRVGSAAPSVRSPAAALVLLYLALVGLYAWQAWRRETPTIFTDELELTQLSRSIADGGSPERRGETYERLPSLYAYLTAPAWWLGGVAAPYAAIKLLGVTLMTAAVFPAYGLARLAVRPAWALAAAALAGAAPALAYAPFLVEEPLAYPVSTLALWLTARFGASPSPIRLGVAAAACVVGFWSRTQLVVLFAVLAIVCAALLWRTERMRRWRSTWTAGDWASAAMLLVGAAVAFSAYMGHRSFEWYLTTGFFKERMLEYGLWAAGALAIGVGIAPLVAGLAALVPPRGETLTAERRAFVLTAAAAIAAFGWYTAVKAAWISATFSLDIVERNLIYVVPVLAGGTALLLERRRARAWAVAAAGALAAYLVTSTPLSFEKFPNYEAHGLAIASLPNRLFSWTFGTVESVLLWATIAVTVALLALAVLRQPRVASALVAATFAFALAWSLTAEIYAADSERDFSDRFASSLTRPLDWIDRTVGDGSVVVFGQQLGTDPNALWSTEFWNRSIERVWSIDGSAPGPGPTLTPDLGAPDGTLTPPPGTTHALALNGVELRARPVRRLGTTTVYRLDGPLRVREARTGVYADGWMGGNATYTRFDGAELGLVLARVTLSRQAWCPERGSPADVRGRVTVRIGPVSVIDKQPGIARVTDERVLTIGACDVVPVDLRAPSSPWRLEVAIEPTFVPNALDPSNFERRELGAVVGFSVVPLDGARDGVAQAG